MTTTSENTAITSTAKRRANGSARAHTPPAPPGAGTGLSHRQIMTILIGLLLGMFLAALDQTIVSTAMPRIANDLNGLNIQAWVTTAYLITSTITTPLYGKLSDIYGRKPFYLAAITIFVIGSAACSFATSMYELAAFRAFQGIGAGGLMSLAFTIMGDILAPRERARYQAYFLAVFGGTSVLGPVVGGALSGANSILGIPGWRWVFLVNVPIGIIALIVVARVLNVPHTRRNQRIDWWGALTLVIGLVPILIVADQGQTWGWGDPKSIGCYIVGAIGIGLFILTEALMKDAALIPLRLFRSPVFTTVILAGVIVGAAMFGGITLIPQYLQIVKGASPTVSGLEMLPMMVGLMGASIMSGQITSRTGRYKIFPIIGSVFIIGGSLLFTTITADSPMWQIMLYMFVFGFGVGNCMQTLNLAAQNAAPPKDMGVSTASATFFRQMGGTLGVAVFLSILFSTVGSKIGDALKSAFGDSSFREAVAQAGASVANHTASPATQQVVTLLKGSNASSSTLSNATFFHEINSVLAHPFEVGFTNSIALVYWSIAGLGVIALLVTIFIKEIPLRGAAGLASAMEGAEALVVEDSNQLDADFAQLVDAEQAELVGAGGRHALTAGPASGNGSVNGTGTGSGSGSGSGTVATLNGHSANGTNGVNSVNGTNGHGVHATDSLSGALAQDAETTGVIGTPVAGTVKRTDGSPVPGAVLTLINHAGQQVARGNSAADGGYRLTAPVDGVYVLIASSAGHQPQASTLRVAGSPVTSDVLLTGTARATGVIRAAEGDPVAAATVTLTDLRGEVVDATASDADGRYLFAELLGGSYTLVVAAASYRPYATTVVVPDSGDAVTDVLLAGAAKLTGVATGGTGRLVADARVTLVDSAGNVVAMTNTDETGAYTFSDVSEGEYTVIASGYPPVTSHPRITAGADLVHNVVLGHTDM